MTVTITDKTEALAVVKSNGWRLGDVSEELKADKQVVLVAVQTNSGAFRHASDDLKSDKEVVMALVKNYDCSGYLGFASDELKADKEVILLAVKNDGYALELASDELKADKEVVMAAIQQIGDALQYASDELKADKEVLAAMGEENILEHEFDELKAKQNNTLVIEVNGRGGDFSYLRLPIDEYKELKDTSFKWMTEKYGDEALSEEIESMWDISMAEVTITLNGKTLISEQELPRLTKTKIEDSQKFWRGFAGADLGDENYYVGIVWFHDSILTSRYEWHNVEEWDPSKLTIDASESSLGDEKDGQCYGSFAIDYNGKNPDESDFESSPKTGYYGPYYFPPTKK
tara:strand:- start:4657 stop:5691 length:1035 start_codon:yes stop_codon:yes gene_type:complete